MTTMIRSALAMTAAIALFALPAAAGPIAGVTATASSTAAGSALAAVNGAGLDAAGHHTTSASDMWVSVGSTGPGADANPTITFDLGRLYAVISATVWDYNAVDPATSQNLNYRGIKTGTIQASADGVAYTTVLSNYAFRPAPGAANYNFGELIAFNTTARFLRFTGLTPFGQYDNLGEVGLAEVQFAGTAVATVPEPAALLLLTAGLVAVLATGGTRRTFA